MRTFNRDSAVTKNLFMSALFALCLPTAGLAAEEHAASAAGNLDKLLPVCQSCHGENGAKPILPEYPVLAGQHRDYLAHSLKDYRSGARKNAVMKAQAANLSDDDIKALALHFNRQEGPLYTPELPKK